MAPAYGEDDYRICQATGIELVIHWMTTVSSLIRCLRMRGFCKDGQSDYPCAEERES